MKLFELYIRLGRPSSGSSWYWRTIELAKTIEIARKKFELIVEGRLASETWYLARIREVDGPELSLPNPLPPTISDWKVRNYQMHGFFTFNERSISANEYWACVGTPPPTEEERPRTRVLELNQ